jgi:hypothetical protein
MIEKETHIHPNVSSGLSVIKINMEKDFVVML